MIQLLTRHTILEARSYLSLGERPDGNEHSGHTHLSCSNPQHHYSRDKHPHHSSSQRWWIMQEISHSTTHYTHGRRRQRFSLSHPSPLGHNTLLFSFPFLFCTYTDTLNPAKQAELLQDTGDTNRTAPFPLTRWCWNTPSTPFRAPQARIANFQQGSPLLTAPRRCTFPSLRQSHWALAKSGQIQMEPHSVLTCD